jgi:hypothetical protein
MHPLASYKLDAGADALDIDMKAGLAYVGHARGGLSVVDLLGGKATRFDKREFGTSIAGVGVDPQKGITYLASAGRSPAPMIVVGRDQAPTIDESPVSRIAIAGDVAAFDAGGHASPAATVSWEQRKHGSSKWEPIGGAKSNVLGVVASQSLDGTQYRAVYTNAINGKHYSTHSASATLRVVTKSGHK